MLKSIMLAALAVVVAAFAAEAADYSDCPPFDQCTPVASWNAPNCKCWDAPTKDNNPFSGATSITVTMRRVHVANAREIRPPAPPPAAAALNLACRDPDSEECHAAAIAVLSRYASKLPTTWKSETPRRWWWSMHQRRCRCRCR